MEHRHLLPDQFEEILDEEAGEETSLLREHLDSCAECRAELAARSELTQALERLLHHGPAPLFAYRVMSEVQVFEPWHVALRDSVRRLVPRTTATRWLAGVTALGIATLLSVAGVWVAVNAEAAWLFTEVGLQRVRAGAVGTVREVLESAFGSDALSAIEGAGTTGTLIAASSVLAVILIAAIGFRVAALASRRRRP